MSTHQALAVAARDAERRGMITHDPHVAIARYDAAEKDYGWLPIETSPVDTTQGDFLIANFNSRGDCCWITIVRNPKNHHGMTIATHWARMFYPQESPSDNAGR
jgi:hypothetical protein